MQHRTHSLDQEVLSIETTCEQPLNMHGLDLPTVEHGRSIARGLLPGEPDPLSCSQRRVDPCRSEKRDTQSHDESLSAREGEEEICARVHVRWACMVCNIILRLPCSNATFLWREARNCFPHDFLSDVLGSNESSSARRCAVARASISSSSSGGIASISSRRPRGAAR